MHRCHRLRRLLQIRHPAEGEDGQQALWNVNRVGRNRLVLGRVLQRMPRARVENKGQLSWEWPAVGNRESVTSWTIENAGTPLLCP